MSTKSTVLTLITCMIMGVSTSAHAGETGARQNTVNTPISEVELLTVLRKSHKDAYGEEPSKNRLAMAWAQVAGENGRGKWTYNHNIGNVAPYTGDQQFFIIAAQKYRHFVEFIDGAKAYWSTVRNCKPAIAAFDSGDAKTSAEQLKKCGYYGADVAMYVRSMKWLYNYAINTLIPEEEHARRQEELGACTE